MSINLISEVERCVSLYQNDDSFLPCDREYSVRNLFLKIRQNKFVREYRVNGEIRAWIYADIAPVPHSRYKAFQQMYYGSDLTGVSAVRSVVTLHDLMFEEAVRLGCDYAISFGSPYDEANTFARILEKHGWQRRGYLAVRPAG